MEQKINIFGKYNIIKVRNILIGYNSDSNNNLVRIGNFFISPKKTVKDLYYY
jgi:hypothetical protein